MGPYSSQWKCPRCGAENIHSDSVCTNCGISADYTKPASSYHQYYIPNDGSECESSIMNTITTGSFLTTRSPLSTQSTGEILNVAGEEDDKKKIDSYKQKKNKDDLYKYLATKIHNKAKLVTWMILTENIIKVVPVAMISSLPFLIVIELENILDLWWLIGVFYGIMALSIILCIKTHSLYKKKVDLLEISIQYASMVFIELLNEPKAN